MFMLLALTACEVVPVTPAIAPPATSRPQSVSLVPKRIGLQAGHWRTDELPDELAWGRSQTGAAGEREVNLAVANAAADLLRKRGHVVDVLPATIPISYAADVFVALHCDGADPTARGYKVARSDFSQIPDVDDRLVTAIKQEYAQATGLPWIGNINANMTQYFAFNRQTYQHSIAGSTPGVILEMGYMTNPEDQRVLTQQQDKVAQGVANGILRFLSGAPVQTSRQPTAASSATLFVIDISGSMGDSWRGGVKIESAKVAATQVLEMIEQESKLGEMSHQVGLGTFSSSAQLDLALTTDYAQARDRVAGLRTQARTNIGAALQVANQALGSAPPGSKKIVILLSDGMTNEGLSSGDILSGPVQEAAAAGTCIYTIGFGEPGDLDEVLLGQIAASSGCGEYYYASAASQLEQVYIRLRHQSLGKIVAEYQGQVSQGQTASIGTATVPVDQGSLYATLHWPGSALDFIITDPRGRRVDQNYPGANIVVYARMVYIIVQNPLPGAWLASTVGRDVPEGVLNYEAIFSVRQRSGLPSTPSPSIGLIFGVLIVALVAAGAVGYMAVQQSSGRLAPAGAPMVQLVRGQARRTWARVGRRGLVIGRDPRCGMAMTDPKVSRQHAQIAATLSGYMITDLNSTAGTYVNGQRVTQAALRGGETIRLGDTELVFQVERKA